jgi:RHS repeat-associated protein
MSHGHILRRRRGALAVAIHLALLAGAARATDTPAVEQFPAYVDGQLVPARFDDPNGTGRVHHDGALLGVDVATAVKEHCAQYPSLLSCELKSQVSREIRGASGKHSAYSVLDITVIETNSASQIHERVINGNIHLVRSCPTDSILVSDDGAYLENRDIVSGSTAVACVSPDALPKSASLGMPEESGANQCPIGNSPTVGNPINPLTMTKIERVVDYAGPASSGLVFARTYHSGAFSLEDELGRVGARYPAGARVGARWRHSWDRAFVRRPYYDRNGFIYTSALHLVREDGNETRFVKRGDTFVPAEGERGTLKERAEGGWEYTWPDLTIEHYDGRGRLRSRTDANGNTVTLQYGEITVGIGLKATVLVGVSDRQGRTLVLSYDRLGRLETVDQPDGGRLRYSYSGYLLEGLDADLVKVTYPDNHTAGYLYDEPAMGGTPNHKLTGIVGGDGKRFATFRYDGFNRAIGSMHGEGLEGVGIGPHSDGVSIETEGQLGGEFWSAQYVNGRIRLGERKEKLRDGEVIRRFDYVGADLVARQTDYLGVPTTYRYDADRLLEIERTEADGTSVARTTKTNWHPVFAKPIRIDNGAQWTTFAYDTKGNLLEQREGGLADAAGASGDPWPADRVTRYAYDATGRVTTIDGPVVGSDDVVHYSYHAGDAPGCGTEPATCPWRAGDLHDITNAMGQAFTVLARDGAGRVLSSTDANGVRTDRRYDGTGRPTEIAVRAGRDGMPSSSDMISRIAYNANGQVETLTDADGVTLTHRYNSAHRLIEQVDALGNRRSMERTVKGLVGKEVYARPDGTEDQVYKYEYDQHDTPTSVSSGAIGTIYYTYDADGRYVGQHDNAFYKERVLRDARGRASQIEIGYDDALGKSVLTYDGNDQVKTVVDPKGLSTAYLRNGLGDLLWRRSPDTGDTTLENDENGSPIKETPADGRQTQRTYDPLGRLSTVIYSDSTQNIYSYDTPAPDCAPGADFAKGRLTMVTDHDGSTSYCYDFAGRVVQKTQVVKGVRLDLRYAYTAAGRLAALTYPDGRRVTYTRNATGQVASVDTVTQDGSPALALVTAVQHDAPGHVTGWAAGARVIQRLHDISGNLYELNDSRADGLQATLVYDRSPFMAGIKARSISLDIVTDGATRVATAGSTDLTPENPYGYLQNYTYDKIGNRTSWMSSPFTFRRYVYAADSHHLLTANKVAREYDAKGNTTRIGEREFIYDAAGRMSQAKVNDIVEMTYAYSPLGQQVAKYIAGQTTVSLHDESGHWLGDYDGAGRAIRQIAWLGDLPVGAFDGDAIRDIQPDHLGTPRIVVDRASDKAIWMWNILGEPFGSDAPAEDPDEDGTKYVFAMRFPGQRYDAVTGLFQNGWRDYDPSTGRYIQSDPIGLAGGISTYAYVRNNPFIRTDPSGLDQIVALDMQAFRWRSSGFGGTTGHAALLIGEEDGVTGWDYYSKDGEVDGAQRYVRKHYSSIVDLYKEYPGRYMEGEVLDTTAAQDADARGWANENFDSPYNAVTNNCADLVYGALEAGGVQVNRPFVAAPKSILGNIDRSGGLKSRSLNPKWYPGKYGYPKSAFNW